MWKGLCAYDWPRTYELHAEGSSVLLWSRVVCPPSFKHSLLANVVLWNLRKESDKTQHAGSKYPRPLPSLCYLDRKRKMAARTSDWPRLFLWNCITQFDENSYVCLYGSRTICGHTLLSKLPQVIYARYVKICSRNKKWQAGLYCLVIPRLSSTNLIYNWSEYTWSVDDTRGIYSRTRRYIVLFAILMITQRLPVTCTYKNQYKTFHELTNCMWYIYIKNGFCCTSRLAKCLRFKPNIPTAR